MHERFLLLRLLFRHYYGRYKRADVLRIVLGLCLLVTAEVWLIHQADLGHAILNRGYLTGSLLFMNVYMTLLSVHSQWRESFLRLVVTLPIRPRVFWVSQIVFLFIDTCLRRTLFFFVLPVVLFINSRLSLLDLAYWLIAFMLIAFYSLTVGVAAGNLLYGNQLLRLTAHSVALLVIFTLIQTVPILALLLGVVHSCWIIIRDFPGYMQIHRHNKHGWRERRRSSLSFYRREWTRFLASRAMVLNVLVMTGFVTFFCYNLINSNLAKVSAALLLASALLLTCSPIALLYSIEKPHRRLFQILPIERRPLFVQKYVFYLGLLLACFAAVALCLILLFEQQVPYWRLLQCVELLAAGAFIRLKSDECRPILDWQTEQKLWSHYRKYQSYLYGLPLFLTDLFGTFASLACIPVAAAAAGFLLTKQEGDFLDQA